jgi:ribosomal protein S18 acetylase RimI-like enzyme
VSEAAPVHIRKAGAPDIAAVAAIFLACWRRSYSAFLPRDVIERFNVGGARALWRRSLTGRDVDRVDRVVLVAERPSGDLVGVIGIGRDPDEQKAGHVYSLYVDPDAQGLHIGARLLGAAIDHFVRIGVDEATLWVFTANSAARGFYARHGWTPDGGRRVEPEYGEPEVRLRRRIREAVQTP